MGNQGKRRTLKIGVTGPIGSGKTVASDRFKELGAVVIEADDVAKQLMRKGTDVYRRVVEAFGPEILADDGEIDRHALASIIFVSEAARAVVNGIVHPAVIDRVLEMIADYEKEEPPMIVVAAALFGASSGDIVQILDEIVFVTTDETLRTERLVQRGMDPVDIRRRTAAGVPVNELEEIATIVVENKSSKERLRSEIDAIWEKLAG